MKSAATKTIEDTVKQSLKEALWRIPRQNDGWSSKTLKKFEHPRI